MRAIIPAIAAALLCLSACDFEDFHDGGSRYNADFHYSHPLAANGRVSVETFNGSVEVTGWDENTVDISGTKYGRTQQLADDIQVTVDHTPTAVSVRVVRPTEIRNGNMGARLVIKVPRGAILDRVTSSNGSIRTIDGAGPARFHTSNGAIRVTNLKGTLEAQTSNGSITADLTGGEGPVRLDTSNGAVELRLPSRFEDDVRVRTSNGGITVRAPGGLNARLAARTSNGKIVSDHDVRTSGEISRTRMEGVLGAGGPLLDLTTSNGGIRITH
jgi:DUF4097 and DUF4098 domain-containing protein YvlB